MVAALAEMNLDLRGCSPAHRGRRNEVCIDMCIDMWTYTYIDMCIENVFADMCIGMLTDMPTVVGKITRQCY